MVKILKTHIYDIVDIVKIVKKKEEEEEINPNDIDIDEQIIEEDDNGLNIIEDDDDDEDEEDIHNIINDYIEFDDEDDTEIKILEKKTFNYLTKYERCFILGIRIQQIMNNSPIFIDTAVLDEINPSNIAYEELLQRKLPFKIKRKLPNGNVEIWDLEDLIIL